MASTRYNVVRRYGGWSIACGDVEGPPYLRQETAVRDVTWIADLLEQHGEHVEVYVEGRPVEIDHDEADPALR
jgi:hypothetical protein